jgi:predicted nucleotidyltransferase component of viral defense system
MIDKETLQDLAKELKIDYFTVSREYLQLLFLKYFYSQKESEKVYFKGGTALRFLFGSFRFSEDLDFTSLLTKSKLKILINKTLQDFKKEAGEISFQEEKTITDAFTGRIFQKIKEFNFPLTIRLDFSLREKPFLTETSYLETVFPIGPFPQVSHLKIEELMAEKVRAILARNKGRDIFDLYFLLSKQVPIDWKLVNKKMALYKKTADSNQLIKAITDFPQEEIKNDLTKFLPLTHRDLVNKIKELTLNKLKVL